MKKKIATLVPYFLKPVKKNKKMKKVLNIKTNRYPQCTYLRFTALAIVLCLATTSTAFAQRGHHYRNRHGYNHGHHSRPHHYKHFRGGHRNDGLGIAVGVVGGLLLGSALMYSASPPRRTVVYRESYTTYQPEVIVRQPRICVEERIIDGQWQTSRYDGSQVWVSFLNPVHQRIQVRCD